MSKTGAEETVSISIPRSALTIVEPTRAVTQRNCARALGLAPRRFLALVRRYGAAGGDVVALGKTRLVEVDPFLAWMKRLERRATSEAGPQAELGELWAQLGIEESR